MQVDSSRNNAMNEDTPEVGPGFSELGLPETLLRTLAELGYEAPSPIQAATIPALLRGGDVLGQAQTGTGKTAAFALPILARLALRADSDSRPSALVLAPTRELAIQVAEAFHRYAAHVPGFHVLPIYGGQSYAPQLAGLRRGADVVVGTPGRIIDHLDKGTLKLDGLQTLVLDEADEMLRMGFIDEVGQVLEKVPASCQKALFSATMPDPIRRIADRHLDQAEHITIRASTTTATNIRQRCWVVGGMHKLDALTRILEVEEFDAMIVFARTRIATEELAQRLEARGFSAAALHGDVPQNLREKIVDRLKRGEVDILVATDVAARGLDVDRISHVVNYDIPYDTEAYVHRIGRTGRAGRSGEAILFVAPRERNMLRAIERATRQPIEQMTLPTIGDVNQQRLKRFRARIEAALEDDALASGRDLVQQNLEALQVPLEDLAAALALMARGDSPLLLDEREATPFEGRPDRGRRPERFAEGHAEGRASSRPSPRSSDHRPGRGTEHSPGPEAGFVRYRIDVGAAHGVGPGNIMGAIANEANLSARQIGRIRLHDECSHVELPAGMSPEVLKHLEQVWVGGRQLQIREDAGDDLPPRSASTRPAPGRGGKPGRPSADDAGPRGRKPSFAASGGPGGDAPRAPRSPGGKFGKRASGDSPRPPRGERPDADSTAPRKPRPPGAAGAKATGKPPRKTFAGKAPGKVPDKAPWKGEGKGKAGAGKPDDAGRTRRAAPSGAAGEGGKAPPKRPKLKRPPRTRAERKEFLAWRKKP
jgi:ATP-dependent RNA helicase DeaD